MDTIRKYVRYGKTIGLYIYFQVFQALNKTIIGKGKHHYEIRYLLHDRVYRVRTKMKRGPPIIIGAFNEKLDDITEELLSFLGPNYDFHGHPMSPNDLGFDKIQLILRDGRNVWIEGQCKIHLDEINHHQSRHHS